MEMCCHKEFQHLLHLQCKILPIQANKAWNRYAENHVLQLTYTSFEQNLSTWTEFTCDFIYIMTLPLHNTIEIENGGDFNTIAYTNQFQLPPP
jgi:hypothetical protein